MIITASQSAREDSVCRCVRTLNPASAHGKPVRGDTYGGGGGAFFLSLLGGEWAGKEEVLTHGREPHGVGRAGVAWTEAQAEPWAALSLQMLVLPHPL